MIVRRTEPTVGEFLAEVRSKVGLKARTFNIYAKKFRTLSAGVIGIKSDSKQDTCNGGYERWVDKVEAIKLSRLTPARVQAWKVRYLKAHESNPAQYKRAKRTVNSLLRNSKALFGKKSLRFIELSLPDPLPFDGIEFEKVGKPHYKSEFNSDELIKDAQGELADSQPEAYKIFILALAAGLRRGEIDTLMWSQVDFESKAIRIEATAYGGTKSDSSEADVDIHDSLVSCLSDWQGEARSIFVIESEGASSSSDYHHYRCQRHFERLVAWLRAKGIRANNPLHALRKEFGSSICQQAGIYAASLQLRHSDIRITRDYYLDKKERVTFKILSA